MRKLVIILTFLLFSYSFAGENNLNINEKQLKEIQERINQIINSLSKVKKSSETGEKKFFLDKINFYPELRIRVDSFHYKLKPFKAEQQVYSKNPDLATKRGAKGFTKNYDPHYYTRLRLNMYTQFIEDLKFIGRVLVVKHTHDNQRMCILTNKISSSGKETPTIIEFDRAYFDWKFYKNPDLELTFTAGILPTSGGQSSNLSENTPRKSFFPSLIFDATSLGGILTARIKKDYWIRFVYGKGYTLNSDIFYFQCNRENILNDDLMGVFAETKIFGIKNSLIYLGFLKNGKIKAVPYLGQFSAAGNKNTNTDLKYMEDLGDIYNIGAGLQIEKIARKLDIFFNFGLSIPDGNGNCMNYTSNTYPECKKYGSPYGSGTTNDVFTNARYAGGPLLKKNGYAFYTGFRYTFKRLKKAKTGVEFNYGSKWWWSATQGSEDVFNKLATRGYAVEAYHIQPFNRFIYLKLGYLYIKEKYSGSGWHFGYPVEKNGTIQNFYILFNVHF